MACDIPPNWPVAEPEGGVVVGLLLVGWGGAVVGSGVGSLGVALVPPGVGPGGRAVDTGSGAPARFMATGRKIVESA
jgi:hypothetical protein